MKFSELQASQTCPSGSKAQLISRVGLYKYTTRKKTTSIHSQYQSWLYTTHYFTWLYFSLQWSHLSGNAKHYSGSISLLYFLSILWITKFIVQKNFAQKRSCLECVMSLHKSNKFHRNFYISPKVEKICLIIFFFHLPIWWSIVVVRVSTNTSLLMLTSGPKTNTLQSQWRSLFSGI